MTAAEKIADAVQQQGGRSVVVRANVSVEAEVVTMFEIVDHELGILWLLSDNAGFVAGANIRIAGGRP